MARTKNGKYYPECLQCGCGLRGEYRQLLHCQDCILRAHHTPSDRLPGQQADREARIRLYTERAARREPLFQGIKRSKVV